MAGREADIAKLLNEHHSSRLPEKDSECLHAFLADFFCATPNEEEDLCTCK